MIPQTYIPERFKTTFEGFPCKYPYEKIRRARVKDQPKDEWVIGYWHVNGAAPHVFGFITRQPNNREILEVDEREIVQQKDTEDQTESIAKVSWKG